MNASFQPLWAASGSHGLIALVAFVVLASVIGTLRPPRGRLRSEPPSPDAPRNLPALPGAAAIGLWIAQGFGLGRVPVMPGTFGSVLGVLWMLALVASGQFWLFLAGLVAGVAASVWLCGRAESWLGQTDPPSVVLDEVVAIPFCFLGWLAVAAATHQALPNVQAFLTGQGWLMLATGFLAFRLFDIAKPWPVSSSQALPRGWGVTVDDLLAAAYANLIWIPFGWLGWLGFP